MPSVSATMPDARSDHFEATKGSGFPRSSRLRAKPQFDRVFKQGRRSNDPLLTLYWLEDSEPARLGLAVSRKVDPRAVGRNRIKRALREGFRVLRPDLRGGAYVLVARSEAARADGKALRAAFERKLHRLGALPLPSALGTMPPARPPHALSPDAE